MVSVVVVGWYQLGWLDGISCGGRMVYSCGGRMISVVWW